MKARRKEIVHLNAQALHVEAWVCVRCMSGFGAECDCIPFDLGVLEKQTDAVNT